MGDTTLKERADILHEFFTSLARKYPGWSEVNIQEFTDIAFDQICQAATLARREALYECLKLADIHWGTEVIIQVIRDLIDNTSSTERNIALTTEKLRYMEIINSTGEQNETT